MADVTPQDAIPATNASNATRYFNLPLFLSTDRPSWLVDWNGAMNEIDTILQDISTASETAVADVATIQTQINTLSTAVQNLNNTVETAVEDVAAMQTTVDSHETRMDAIEADLITQNNLVKSLSDAVTTMQATVATLNNRVASIETTVSGYDARIDAAEDAAEAAQAAVQTVQTSLASLTSTVNGLSSTVSTHTSQISSLNTRVTALENAGGGAGFPAWEDLLDTTKYTLTQQTNTELTSNVTITATKNGSIGYVYLLGENATGSNTEISAVAKVSSSNPYAGVVCGCTPVATSIDKTTVSAGLVALKNGESITIQKSGTSTTQHIYYTTMLFTPV